MSCSSSLPHCQRINSKVNFVNRSCMQWPNIMELPPSPPCDDQQGPVLSFTPSLFYSVYVMLVRNLSVLLELVSVVSVLHARPNIRSVTSGALEIFLVLIRNGLS